MKRTRDKRQAMTSHRSYGVAVGSVVLCAVTVGYILSNPPESSHTTSDPVPPAVEASHQPSSPAMPNPALQRPQPETASPTQPNERKPEPETPRGGQAAEIPFTVDGIYNLVETVSLDEAGHIALGNDTLLALDRLLGHGDKTLAERDLESLDELIRAGLPGDAGQQAATMAQDYYHYLQARNRLTAANRPTEGAATALNGEQLYQELRRVRSQLMGEQVASQLFRTADAQFAYMTQARQLQANPNLTAVEKLDKVRTLESRLQDASIAVNNWPHRRDRFMADRRQIVEAALPEQEKRAQLRALLERDFQTHERQQIEHLELDSL